MAARDDILEKVKKSRQQAEQRIQESNRQAQAERQESQKTYQQNTSAETKKAASYMQDYSSQSRAGNTVAAYAEKRKRSTQWYKGSEPTEAETLAQILKKGEHDDNLGRELYGLYEQAKAEGHWTETYDKPTSQYLTALGIEDPSVINDEFINSLTPYLAAGVNTSTGGLSSAKKNGPDAMLAYNVGGLISDYQDTKELLAEQEQAAKEAQYWIAKGLTDDEIKEKLNIGGEGSKYTKLTSAINKTSTGGVVPTTAPIPLATSYGVDGMLYALRNPDSSKGDFLLDAVQKELGRGVQAQDNPAAKARRTPGSETWNPYINGTTMDDEGIRFGTTQFDKGWLDANRQAILSSGNEDDVKAFTRIYNAEERTAAAESELSDLTSSIEMQLQADPTQDADALIASIFGSSDDPTYKTLAAMDESLLSGAVLDMTRGVAYDRKSIEKYIRDYVADAQLREQATVDPAAMNTVVEQDKAAAAEENGGSLITAGSFLESVPAAVQKSVFGETVDPEMMVEGWTWILNGAKGLFKKNKQEEETAPAETTEETPEGSAQVPAEPIAVVASAGMSDVRPQAPKTDAETQEFLDRWFDGKIPTDDEFAEKYEAVLNDPSVPDADVKYFFERGTEIVGKAQDDVENYQQEVDTAQQTTSDIAAAGTKHLTAEEAQTATALMNDFIENGQYADAAALQFSVLTSAVTDSNDQYVRELVTSVGGQEAAVQLANLVLQGDMVSQVIDPSVREALTQYENYIWAALDADEESKLTFAKALDFVSGGAVSETADNEGVGLFQMLKSTFVKGASGINDSWANLVGAAMTGYGHAVKGTNWIVNNTLGKVFGFQLNDSAAEATIQAGQDVSSYYDKIGANEDVYLRENASTLEYFVATAGGEAIKMGAQSFAGSAIGGRFTDTVGKIMNKGGLRQLTTAMDLSKVEGLMSKVVSASPFIADSFGNQYQNAYSETQNPATATLSALVSAFSTTALMNMDAIKNIENMGGKLIPEVVDAIKAIPGSSLTASFKRFGKAGMMYIGNMLKTAANEAIQEPTENLLTTWATDAIKGKNFFDRDMKAFGQELAQDAFYAAIGTFGNSMASLPSWSRSAIYADQMMGKTGLTMQEVQGQIDAFIADMNDPQVVAQTQANLTAAAEQYVTGELLQQGALGEVNAQPVLKAQEKLDAATTSLNETIKNMQIVSKQRDTASARFAENPADPKATSNMLAAVDAYNKAAQETEAAQAVHTEAQAKLDEASAALKEQTDTAMQAVRAKATVLVEQHVSAASKTNRLDPAETEVYNVGESGGYGNGEEYREYDGRRSSGSDAEGRRGSSKNDRLDSRTAIEGWAPTSEDREEAPGVITRASKGYEAFEKAVKNSGLRYDDGEPIILYHGTRNDFEMMGRMDLTDGPQNYDTSHGIYLTNDINVANLYSFMYGNFEGRQAIHPVALNTDKIARFDADGFGQDPDYQNYVALLIERYNKYAGKENFAQNLEKALARELAEMNIEDHIANLIKSEFERLGKIDAIEVAGAAWNFNDSYVDDQYIVFDPSLLVPATEAYWAEQDQKKDDRFLGGGSSGDISRTQVPAQTVQTGQQNTRVLVNPIESTRKLSDALNIGERIGTRKMNNQPQAVLGYYDNRARYLAVRPNQASNITVAMHEAGHALSQRLRLSATPDMVANLDPAFAQNYPANQLPGEAFAEFVWRYMVNDQQAEDFAGAGFVRQFEQALRDNGLANSVHAARDEMHAWVNATAVDRIRSMIKDRSYKPKSGIRERIVQGLAGLVDSTKPLEAVNSFVRAQNNGQLTAADNLQNVALMRNGASKRAWNMLTGNRTDSDWNIVGESLASVIEETGMHGRDFDLLNSFMLAQHSLDRDVQGLPVFDASITADQRRQMIADVEQNHPEVAAAAQAIHNWWHDFMQDMMVNTGFLTQEALDRFEELYPHYVPTNRVKKQGVVRTTGGGKSYTVRRATGSTEEIYNPMDSLVQNVNSIVEMVSQNNTALTFDRLYHQYDGLGIFGREVTQDISRDHVDVTNLRDQISEILDGANADADVMEQILELIGTEQEEWRGTGRVNLPNILTVQRPDGTRGFYEITDNELFKSLSNMKDGGGALLDYVGRFTRAMSALTTGSNPLFSIRNFARDFQKSVNYGSWASNYGTGAAKWLRAAYDVWQENGEYEQYKALGGGGWTRIDANTKKGATEYRGELFHGYNTSNVGRTAKWAGKKLWNAITLARLNEIVEQTSRYAEYKYGTQDKSTAEGRQQAFLNAQEATVDFSRAGNSSLASGLKQVIPFFNASMQGVYQTVREFTSEQERGRLPARFAKTVVNTAITSAMASVALLKFMDDEDKEEFYWLSDDLKAEHVYLPNFAPEILGEAPLIRIPLAQDPLSRAVHGFVTNAIWSGQGDGPVIEAAAIANNVLSGFNPISGTVFDAAIATTTNKNWYGNRIVPQRMDQWAPSTQYTEETAGAFVAAGRVLNMSPMMLEYLAEQYTGFLGQIIIPAISKDANTGEMQGISATIAEARKKLTSDPLISNDVVNAFYDGSELLTQVTQAAKNDKPANMLRRGLTEREVIAAADEAKAMTATAGIVGSTKKIITDAYNRIDAIEADASLTEKEKYQLTSQIRREIIESALDANEAIGAYNEKYVNGVNVLSRFVEGTSARLSTAYEQLPETFRMAYDSGESYMQRSVAVWEATGKDGALPKVSFSFSMDKVSYEVSDEYAERFVDQYEIAYEKAVNAIKNWDALNDNEKYEALQSAHRTAQNAAKKWYVRKVK